MMLTYVYKPTMMRIMKKIFYTLLLSTGFAEDNSAFINAGRAAQNPQSSLESAQSFVDFGIQFMLTLLLISGIAMLMGAIVQYVEHRKNPVNPPLSRVMTFLIIGIVLVLASFLPTPSNFQ